MRLSNSASAINRPQLPNTWDVIDRISKTLKLSDRDLAEMLLSTDKELEQLKLRKKTLSADKIFSLAGRLDLSFDRVMSGKIDYQALTEHFWGNKNYLPEYYQKSAFSKRRTTLFILNYIEQNYGWRERLSILHHFQLNEAIFAKPDEMINFQFGSDLCSYLYRYKLGAREMANVGVQSFLSANSEQVKKELSDCESVGEIYERMCSSLIQKYFEKNFSYRVVKMSDSHCTVAAKPNPELAEVMENATIINPAISIARTGIAAAYPMILGLPSAEVKLSACLHQGDKETRYEIDFSRAKAALRWN